MNIRSATEPPQNMKYIYWAFVHAIWAYLYIGHTLLGQRKGGVTPPDFVFPILVVLAVSISACIHVNFKVRPFLLKCFYKSSSETGNKTQDPIQIGRASCRERV